MQVFKAYFKVLRKSMVSMAVYLVIFLALSVMFSVNASAPQIVDFTQSKPPITVINRDAGGYVAQGLVDYLAETNQLVSYPDDPMQLQDALFYRNIEYIAIIPPGFTERFLASGEGEIEKVIVPDSRSSYYVDLAIAKYLDTMRLYQQFGAPAEPTQLMAAVANDLTTVTTAVALQDAGAELNSAQGFVYYYAYYAYVSLALVILGVSSIMLAFNRPDVRRRNDCSPLPLRHMNLQLAAGHGVFALSCWGILVLFSFLLYGKGLLSSGLVWLYCLNSLLYTLVATSIGFLVGSFARDYGAQSAAVNVVTMGMSFICGVFVPQTVMRPSVLAVAKFLPTFWYIKANDALAALRATTAESLLPIYNSMLIQLAFAAAIFSITLFLSKERRRDLY